MATFVAMQSVGLPLICTDERTVRATQGTILLNGKQAARFE